MNHDPIRFCFECRKMKPAKDFRPLSRERGNVRWVCPWCFTRIEAARKMRREQASDRADRGTA